MNCSKMHFDTRLIVVFLLSFSFCSSSYSDDQSYLSLVEFHRGGELSNVILASPHGGFLGANLTLRRDNNDDTQSVPLVQLPIGGCYNNTLDRCVYTLRDCLRSDSSNVESFAFQVDGRCLLDRSSTSAMYLLTKSIGDAFSLRFRPYLILNKLTRQYVDPAEDLLVGTFLFESSIRTYVDYHRLIAMAKEATRPTSRGLFIEFLFHKNSQTVQLGYGFEASRSSMLTKPIQSTVNELLTRSGPSVIRGNQSLGYFLRQNGFEHVIPLEYPNQQQGHFQYRFSTHSTRTHADQRFNAIVFSYPIERLRTHSVKLEATRIAKAIEQFTRTNHIGSVVSSSSSSFFAVNSILISLLFFSYTFSRINLEH